MLLFIAAYFALIFAVLYLLVTYGAAGLLIAVAALAAMFGIFKLLKRVKG
jgi:hypothetical protein